MITNVLKSGRGRQMRRAERCSLRKIRPAVAGCEDRGTGHEPRNVVSSRSWKRQGNKFSPPAPPGTPALLTPWFLLREVRVRILPYRL